MAGDIDLLRPRPDTVAIEVTSRCNLRCAYCHKADPVLEAMPGANDDMTDDMIAELYRYCKAQGVKNVTLSLGGETTMVSGWHHRIAMFLDDPDIETFMVSNFVRPLSDEELEALCRFDSLQISFDSSELAMVRKLRSKGDLRTITYNIVRLRQMGRELGRCPFLAVNCTLCRDNIGHVAKLAGFCRELGVDQLMLTEVMSVGEHNPIMPETLDSLTSDEVLLLAREIIAAEAATANSTTSLRVQEHLQIRIGEVIEQLREGTIPPDAAALFHPQRTVQGSACRQPWQTPIVRALGDVIPCCGARSVGSIGDLAKQSMHDIMNGPRARAIRASILEGRPLVACEGCSLASGMSFEEFARDIGEWMGDASAAQQYDSILQQIVWPALASSALQTVTVENSELKVNGGSAAALIESKDNGYHRVLFDVAHAEYSELRFKARPAGRRRLRVDFAEHQDMVGRAHIIFSQQSKVATPIGPLNCVVTPAEDRWYEVTARLPAPRRLSGLSFHLLREDEAVKYSGDGRSGLEIEAISIA